MATVILFAKKSAPEPQPQEPQESVEEILARLVRMDLASFASDLECARVLWREHREMVEAEEFPEYLRLAYREENDDEVSGVNYGTPDVQEVRANNLPTAQQFFAARHQDLRGA